MRTVQLAKVVHIHAAHALAAKVRRQAEFQRHGRTADAIERFAGQEAHVSQAVGRKIEHVTHFVVAIGQLGAMQRADDKNAEMRPTTANLKKERRIVAKPFTHTRKPSERARSNAGRSAANEPTAGLPHRSTPTTPFARNLNERTSKQ